MKTLVMGKIDIFPLIKAQAFLQNGIEQAQSDLEKAGAIQTFINHIKTL